MTPAEINAADFSSLSAAVAGCAGLPVFVPPGDWDADGLDLSGPIRLRGAGMNSTRLRIDDPAGSVLISSGFVVFKDLDITSSVPAASRTAPGLKITGQTNVRVVNVRSNGHLFGIESQGSGNRFEDCSLAFNKSHGFYGNGTVLTPGQFQMKFESVESNANGADGFCFVGPSIGTYGNHLCAAGNGGVGIRLVNLGNAFETAVSDFFLENVELSYNIGGEFNAVSNACGVGIGIVGGLVESKAQGIFFGQNVNNSYVSSIFLQEADNGIIVDGMGVAISNITARNCVNVIRAGAHSTKLTLSNITSVGQPKPGGVGVFSDTGAGPIVGTGLNFTGTPHNALPVGSVFSASSGF